MFQICSNASYHDRSHISFSTKSWYGYCATPSQLKEDEQYEQRLYDNFISVGMFNADVHPDQLFNIFTKDIATDAVEESLLTSAKQGKKHMEYFVSQRLVVREGFDKPHLPFSGRLSKVKAPTFVNLYDINIDARTKKADASSVINANRNVLQRLVTAYDAKRPVDLGNVTAHELMSVSITIFEPNGSLRSGVKSSMIKPLIGDIEYCALPEHNPATSTIIIDVMSRVQSIGLPKMAVNFGDLADTFTMSVLQSAKTLHRIYLAGDRCSETSIKDFSWRETSLIYRYFCQMSYFQTCPLIKSLWRPVILKMRNVCAETRTTLIEEPCLPIMRRQTRGLCCTVHISPVILLWFLEEILA